MFVILNPSPVTLSPALVILSEVKDLGFLRGVDSAKGLGLWLKVDSANDLITY